jgi:hypothetical protein
VTPPGTAGFHDLFMHGLYTVFGPSIRQRERTMTVRRRRARRPVAVGIALTAGAVITTMLVAGGAAGMAGSGDSAAPISSGAGPGWPRTLQPSDFVRRVTNPWFPLRSGSRWHYRGVEGGSKTIDRVRVSRGTKTILGVRTTVVHDEVVVHGRPVEVTNDFYAQDREGNVWYFGEHTKELDRHGHVTSREGSFKAGRDGARPGVLFPAHPRPGVSARQESFKGHAEDHFEVLSRKARVSVPFVSTRHAVRTKEWTPLEPNVLDNKYYARGIGTVREVTVKGPTERLELVSFKRG